MPYIPEMIIGNTIYKLKDSEMRKDLANVGSGSSPNIDSFGYTRYYLGTPTTNKVLRSSDGKIVDGTGSGNNYAFTRFVHIPKGKLYFAFPYNNDGYNAVFYDDNFNVVDTIGQDNHTMTLYGMTYENTTASFLRVGGYKTGGYTDYDECYVYTMPNSSLVYENRIFPKLLNIKNNGSTRDYQQLFQEDFIYADKPIHVYSKDLDKYVVGIFVYDKDKNLDSNLTWYMSDMKTKSLGVCTPSGVYFKINISKKDGSSISATDDVLNTVVVEKIQDNLGYGSIVDNAYYIAYSTARLTTIDKVYADEDVFISHKSDFAIVNTSIYDSNAYNATPVCCYFSGAGEGKVIRYIPKGFYYRYSVGIDGGTITKADMDGLLVQKRPYKEGPDNTLFWKTRFQNDRDTFPSYYNQHMVDKCAAIRNYEGENTVQFAFLTDYHYGTYDNTNNVRSLLTKLVERTKVGIVFNGGDTWTRGNDVETADTLEESKKRILAGLDETIPNYQCNWFFVLGNHDTGLDYWVHDGITETFGPMVTTEQLSSYVGGHISEYRITYDPNSYGFGYFFDVGNFRFIVTNAGERDEGGQEASTYTKLFMAKALLSMGNKTAIIVGHKYVTSSSSETPGWEVRAIEEVIVAYNARGTLSFQSGITTVNFTGCQGRVACFIAGHTHKDMMRTMSDGTPVFITTSTNAGAGRQNGETREEGTVTENAFDVFSVDSSSKTVYATRIGAGSDRSVSYGS